MEQDERIYSVSTLSAAIKTCLERGFSYVWVRGQVSGLSRPSSGHLYFSLRDEDSVLAAVWFKGSQKPAEDFDPLTGEVYEDGPRPGLALKLEEGREIVCAGRIRVYEPRGVYQLVVELAREAGLGRLHEEFARLRARLEREGYFAPERKRPLPALPTRVAVITAPSGAAVQDFIRIAETRGHGARIRVYPAPVQGEAAPAKLVAALEQVVADGWAELAVFIRGGGSILDLWAFNDEHLAKAIRDCPLPVLAGIGHETDVTLADMTADLRAATPSHAAQLLWPARQEFFDSVARLAAALDRAARAVLTGTDARLRRLERDLDWRSPLRLLESRRERLDACLRLLRLHGTRLLEPLQTRLADLRTRLAPAAGRQVAAKRQNLDRLGLAVLRPPKGLAESLSALESLKRRLDACAPRLTADGERRLEREQLRLEAFNPLAPLERGYALARREDGSFVNSVRMVSHGDRLRLMVRDGEIPVLVEPADVPADRKETPHA